MQVSRHEQIAERIRELSSSLGSENSVPQNIDRREIIKNRIQELQGSLPKEDQDEFSYARFIPEKVAQGVTNLADLPHVAQQVLQSGPKQYPEEVKNILEKYGIKPPESKVEVPQLSPYLRKGIKAAGIDIESEKPTTPIQRMIGKGAETVGESIFPLGRAAQMAKRAGVAGTIGATAGGLEELGVDPTAAMIASSIGVPTATAAAKGLLKVPVDVTKYALSPAYREQKALQLGEEEAAKFLKERVGHENIPEVVEELRKHKQGEIPLTTAEMSRNVGLAQAERALEGELPAIPLRRAEATEAIQKQLSELPPGEHNILTAKEHAGEELRKLEEGARKAKEALEAQHLPHEAGEKIGKEVREHYKELRSERHEKTKPLYEEVKKVEKGYSTKNVLDSINEELPDATGKIRKALYKAKSYFAPEHPEMLKRAEENLARAEVHGKKGYTVELQKEVDNLKSLKPNKLKNAISSLSDDILSAEKSGREAEATVLKKVKKAAMEDIGKIPEEAAARKLYSELSKPITERRKHPIVGKILKKDLETKNYIVGDTEIPSRLINKSMKTKEQAEDFVKTYGGRKNVLEDTKKYINYDVSEAITREGNVDLKLLEKWKKDNPYYKTIYPELDAKLSNINNAQKMVNDSYVRNMKESDSYYKGAFKAYAHEDPTKVIRTVFSSPHKGKMFDKVIDIAKSDKTGNSLIGLKRAVIDDLLTQTRSAGIAATTSGRGINEFIPNQYLKYYRENGKNFAKIFDKDEMKLLDHIADIMHRKQQVATAGHGKGSPTSPNISLVQMMSDVQSGVIKKMIGKIYGVGKIMDFIDADTKNMAKNAKRDLIREALLDKDRAIYLLEKPSDKANFTKAWEKIKDKSFMATPIILQEEKEEENE